MTSSRWKYGGHFDGPARSSPRTSKWRPVPPKETVNPTRNVFDSGSMFRHELLILSTLSAFLFSPLSLSLIVPFYGIRFRDAILPRTTRKFFSRCPCGRDNCISRGENEIFYILTRNSIRSVIGCHAPRSSGSVFAAAIISITVSICECHFHGEGRLARSW